MLLHSNLSLDCHLAIANSSFWLAQTFFRPRVATPEEAALLFSGPKFFIALISGVLLAFGFQFLLTNLSVAAGMTYLGRQTHKPAHQRRDRSHHSPDEPSTIRKISSKVGLWTLLTVTIALFLACSLAVRLSLVLNPFLGAIIGLVIWAAYFCLLLWLSSRTVGSVVGSAVNTVTASFQSIVETATAALGSKIESDRVAHTARTTARTAARAVRRELNTAIDTTQINRTLENYLDRLRPPEFNVREIRREFESLLRDPDLQAAAVGGNVRPVDRSMFVNLIRNRTDLSDREVNQLADELEGAWKRVVERRSSEDRSGERRSNGHGNGHGNGSAQSSDKSSGSSSSNPLSDFQHYLASALPESLRSGDLGTRVEQVISRLAQPVTAGAGGTQSQGTSLLDQTLQLGMTALVGTVMGRTDLSDLDVEKIVSQLRSAFSKVGEQAGQVVEQVQGHSSNLPPSTIHADIEHYLLTTYAWQFTPETIDRDFREVLHDPTADPHTVRLHLESIDRNYFVNLLNQRNTFMPTQVEAIADHLERLRLEVLADVRLREMREIGQGLVNRLETYLRVTPKEVLLTDQVQTDFVTIFDNLDAFAEEDPALQQDVIQRFDRTILTQLISRLLSHQGEAFLTPTETEQVLRQLELGRDRVRVKVDEQLMQQQSQARSVQSQLEQYLQNTHANDLTTEGIRRDLQTLFSHPEEGLSALRTRFSHFDRQTLVQLLSQRQDLSPEQVNQVLNQIESIWNQLTHSSNALSEKARAQYDQFSTRFSEYLQQLHLEQLHPEDMQRELTRLLDDPSGSASALRQRLSQLDRDTIASFLSQRSDLSEEQAQHLIDQVQLSLRQVVRAPRRFAVRTQRRVMNFEGQLEDYLRNTNKWELNPEGIKRDLEILLHSPGVGLGNLEYRLSKIDRSALIALLSQRQDMTEAEAAQVVDQVLAVRNQVMDQVRNVQQRVQSVVDSIFDRLRHYLDSLQRPELNYEGIRSDVQQLFSDPRSGFDALRDRVSHFNRDTLIAVLTAGKGMSSTDAYRVLRQVEEARDSVLRRGERFQQTTQTRIVELKRQAQRQAEETRKAAESASWWLFGTAITSALVSALAGAIAVL